MNIPAGVDNEQTLRTQIGKAAFYVTLYVSPSIRHRREKEDIYTDVEVDVATALLGGTVVVPGIYNDTTVKIPPGTSSHTQMVLRGSRALRRLGVSRFPSFNHPPAVKVEE